MFKPSTVFTAWSQLARLENNPIAKEAADVLESDALYELKHAWLNGQISPTPSQVSQKEIDLLVADFTRKTQGDVARLNKTVTATPDAVIVSNQVPDTLTKSNETSEASQAAADLGELPQVFKGTSKSVCGQTVRKLWRKKAESLGLTQTELAKKVGMKAFSSMSALRSKSKTVSTQYADFLAILLGPEVLV